MNKYYKTFISAIIAGICISIGGTCFLSLDNKVIGAFMFSLGLLTICSNEFHLFTGKVCFARKWDDYLNLLLIWIGNFVGCGIIGFSVKYTRPQLIQKAVEICNIKMTEKWWMIIILGIFCNVLIFFAVNNFKETAKKEKVVLLIMCVMAFILCGFEHCVANMFYFIVAGTPDSTRYILLNTVGNAAGGLAIGLVCERLKVRHEHL